MKNTLVIIFTLLSTILFAQNEAYGQLRKLLLDLDLSLDPRAMTMNSQLKFKYGVNRGINFQDEKGNIVANNTYTYEADFIKNPLIKSEIKKGEISVIQKEEVQFGAFSVNERIWFKNVDDLINEYRKICSSFEKYGYQVKNTIVEDDNFNIKNERTEIMIPDSSKKAQLMIGFLLPPKDDENKEYLLSIIYSVLQ
ncbi:hypothetical protein AAW12_24075 [Sphingobacterium sp. Ag1]|uniref:hypothetical protein n=1 Tax=Sphingobacterium sp. Ag1 TaxID=1643451 RepID=UPI00062810DB|nr:hypothetical protein [Sphingobacterium sp. Ag1]KKO89204.1 hypothetical protein AAW12_24075 [Sphingobacterium sp. Ag1]